MIRIERIENVGPEAKARLLVFSDTRVRRTSASVVRELGLESGAQVDLVQLERTLGESEERHAKERALRILGYRDRSVTELRKRLSDDGYPDAVLAAVVDRFCEVELVDDARFARSWAATRAAAGIGRARIARELREKGVDPDLALSAIEDALVDQDEVGRALAALRGKVPADRRERDRLLRRLVTRGFELGVAIRALDAAGTVRSDCDSPLNSE